MRYCLKTIRGPAQSVGARPAPAALRREAFSLLELLVVVAIIALLASMAIPSMTSLAEQARRVSCQAQMASLARGALAYGCDAAGWLPPGPVERGFWAGDPDRGLPYELYDARRAGDPALNSNGGWYGLGLIWKSAYVDRGELYYCPSAGRRGGVKFRQAWPRGFDSLRDPSDGKTRICCTIVYRGGLSSKAGSPLGPVNVRRTSADSPVLADNPCAGRMWHEGGYNIAFADTRVEFYAFESPVVPAGHLPALWQAVAPSNNSPAISSAAGPPVGDVGCPLACLGGF